MRIRTLIPLAVMVLATAACAYSGTQGPRPDPELITRTEIQSAEATNLYDVVRRLRPRWLNAERRSGDRSFGSVQTGVVVYQNRSYLGGLSVLEEWSPEGVYQLEWIDGPQASASLPGIGSRHVVGAIIIHTSPPSD
jgi:hypothetical protein